jgi:hypothetical protein
MCATCGKGFNEKGTLKTHSAKHLNESLYKCVIPDCPVTTKIKKQLIQHLKKDHHVYYCKLCQIPFKIKEEYLFHQQGHTDLISNFATFLHDIQVS